MALRQPKREDEQELNFSRKTYQKKSLSMMTLSGDSNNVQPVNRDQASFWALLEDVSSSLCWLDIVVFALILGFGAMQFFFAARASDFFNDDVFFSDSARSLLEHGSYGINGYAETNMPPGLPAMLGFFWIVGGWGHLTFLRVMAVFGTLGFLASYELLRRQVPRIVAATICLLLISSRIHFELVTQWFFPSYPYFFAATSALLVARKLESATHFTSRVGWGILLMALIAASLMFASAGIALLGAIVASIGVLIFRERQLAFTRLRRYLAVLLVGVVVQGFWMNHERVDASSGIAASEWPLPGFPQSYMSQLKVKSGNNPELGMATPTDFVVRILKNTYQQSYLLSQTLLGRSTYITSISILVLGPLLLIILGWCYCIWRTGGGLQEWYFAGYEFIYIVWPWTLETRFLLPIAPLACLYMWRGAEALGSLAKYKPGVLGWAWLPLGLILTACSWSWMRGVGIGKHLAHAGLQDEASFIVWLLTAILAFRMIWADIAWAAPIAGFLRRCAGLIGASRIGPLRISQFLAITILTVLVGNGLATQLRIGRTNLDANSAVNRPTPDAEAASWIRAHTDPNAVVMARHVPTAYHYSGRKVIWFPPSSNPQLLMEGIQKHKIDFVVVVRRENSYYLPSDDDCFAPLLEAYPDAFRLVDQAPEFRIFQVATKAAAPPRVTLGAFR